MWAMETIRRSALMRGVGAACAAALMVASVGPAAARGPGGAPHGGGHGGYETGHGGGRYPGPIWRGGHRHGGYGGPYWGGYYDGWGAGDVIGLAALIGVVAVLANSAARDRDGDRTDDRSYDRDTDRRDARSGRTASIVTSDDAANACADAAREEAEAENHGYARLLGVDQAQPYGAAGGWSVDGRVEQLASAQDRAGTVRRFSCEVEDGHVAHVYLSRDTAD